MQIGHTMESMDVTEQDYCTLTSRFSNVTILNSRVLRLDTDKKVKDGLLILCLYNLFLVLLEIVEVIFNILVCRKVNGLKMIESVGFKQ